MGFYYAVRYIFQSLLPQQGSVATGYDHLGGGVERAVVADEPLEGEKGGGIHPGTHGLLCGAARCRVGISVVILQ